MDKIPQPIWWFVGIAILVIGIAAATVNSSHHKKRHGMNYPFVIERIFLVCIFYRGVIVESEAKQ